MRVFSISTDQASTILKRYFFKLRRSRLDAFNFFFKQYTYMVVDPVHLFSVQSSK